MALLKLARQLGVLKTINVELSQLSTQHFKYLICVDFEATCWENQAPVQWRETEIIEFPAVLVNLQTGKIEAEFHEYVKPFELPKLSAYCIELTGVKQQDVENGMPLEMALKIFQEWLRKELRTRNLQLPKMSKDKMTGNCALVTWSNCDFGIFLEKECRRKNLKKPSYFNQWIDLSELYNGRYKYKPTSFVNALSHVGIKFEGRQHSGRDDARNLATLAYKMVCDGVQLKITKDLTPHQLNANCML